MDNIAEAPATLKAEELSFALMEEEEEEEVEGHAYEGAICEDKLMESMQALRPLLINEEGNSTSESSFLHNPSYDTLEQDILLSCDDLSPSHIDDYHDSPWCIDHLHHDPPPWITALSIEDLNTTNNHMTSHPSNILPLSLNGPHAQYQGTNLAASHHPIKHSDSMEGINSLNMQEEWDCTAERMSDIDPTAGKPTISIRGDSEKRALEGGRNKWPHLHSFLKGSSSKGSMQSKNVGKSRDDGINVRGGKSNYDRVSSSYKREGLSKESGSSSKENSEKSFKFSKGIGEGGFLKVSSSSEDDEGIDKASNKAKGALSKNLISERRRRQKLNERLYSLRALVPNISKMDKASIVGDAITYVRDLQKQVHNMEEDISHLESTKDAISADPTNRSAKRLCRTIDLHAVISPSQRHQIVELDITKMEGQLYQFRIHCKKTPGVLLQLTRALESLEFEIVNANLTSINDHILNTLVIEVTNIQLLKCEDVRDRTLEAIPKFGLFLTR